MEEQDLLIEKAEYDNAASSQKEAADNFMMVQAKVKDAGVEFAEKLAFYAAGVISLSFTFIGYVLNKDSSVLLVVFLKIPLYVYLFICWGLLALTVVSGLMIRWFDSLYYYYNATVNLVRKNKDLLDRKRSLVQNDYPILLRSGESKEQMMANMEEDMGAWKIKADKYEKHENRYWRIKVCSQHVIIYSFVLGIVAMTILFSVVITLLV